MQNNVILPGAASSLVRRTSAAAMGLCATLLGCSEESINMGEGVRDVERSGVPSSSRCAESPILKEDVVVHNQQELDALEGCEVIEGSLYVAAFEGGQLRALHALRAVSNEIAIGQTPDPYGESEHDVWVWQMLTEKGWLSSLEGLDALESAASLYVMGLTAKDLAPLSSLRWLTASYVGIESAHQLKNLDGLQNLTGLRSLRVVGAPQLESLDGLTLARSMDYLELSNVDLRRVKPLEAQSIQTVWLVATQLHDLTPFANLDGVTGIQISSNQKLESLAGLEGLSFVESLNVSYNPSLLDVPDFDQAYGLQELRIIDNPKLARLPAFPALGFGIETYQVTPPGEELIITRPEVIQLQELSSVTTFSMPPGWASAGIVQIENNANLQSIEFTGQTYVDYLLIQNNPLLETVSIGVLDKVNEIHVVDNPRFSVSAFDGIRHLDMTASGNAP